MFGKMGDMMAQLKEMKQAAEESKRRLDDVLLEGKSKCKRVIIQITGNQEIKSMTLDHDAFESTDELTQVMVETFNRAIDAAKKRQEKEMKSAAKGMLPNIPGLT